MMQRVTIKIMATAAIVACANGSSAGRSTTMGNTTYYYGPNGAPAGTATRTGW